MKIFYITTQQEFLNGARHFSNAHYIDLPSGKILLAAEHRTLADKSLWESRNTIVALPHPLSGKQVGADVAQELSSIGVKSNHSVWDVAEIAKAVHGQMGLDE